MRKSIGMRLLAVLFLLLVLAVPAAAQEETQETAPKTALLSVDEVKERIEAFTGKWPNGSYWGGGSTFAAATPMGGRWASRGCHAFAAMLTEYIYGEGYAWYGPQAEGQTWTVLGEAECADADAVRSLVSQAQAGDVVYFHSEHKATFLSYDAETDTFYTYDGNYAGRVVYNLAHKCTSVGYRSMTIYRSMQVQQFTGQVSHNSAPAEKAPAAKTRPAETEAAELNDDTLTFTWSCVGFTAGVVGVTVDGVPAALLPLEENGTVTFTLNPADFENGVHVVAATVTNGEGEQMHQSQTVDFSVYGSPAD